MTALTIKDFDTAMNLGATSKAGVSKLVKAWEATNTQNAKRIAGLGLMAVSLAACNDSSEDDSGDDTDDEAVSTNYTLTTDAEIVSITSDSTEDKIFAVVDGDGDADSSESTLTSGDYIVGNDLTVLRMALVEAGAADYFSISNIATIELVNATTGAVSFEAGDWSDIGEIVMDSGSAGGEAFINDLEDGVDLTISVEGILSASFTVGLYAQLEAGDGDSLSFVDNDLAVSADSTSAYADFSGADVVLGDISAVIGESAGVHIDLTATTDTTVGSVSADLSASADFSFHMYGGGDMIAGDILVEGGASASASAYLSNTDGGDVTVGNVDIETTGAGHANLNVYNFSATGEMTIGAVSLAVGQSGWLDLDITHTGILGESVGGLTVGDITLTMGDDAGRTTDDIQIDSRLEVSTTGQTLGDMTVGNMVIDMGADATLSMTIDMELTGASGSDDAMGDFALGSLDVTLGVGATLSYSVSVSNTASGDVGNVTVGAVTLNFDDGASASLSYDVSATAGSVGDIVIGDLSVTLAVSADLSYLWEVDATGDIASITIGDVDVVMGADSSIESISYDFFASGDIGTVVVGDLNAVVGQTADFDDYYLYISASGSVGDVTIGNVSAVVDTSGSFSYTAYVIGDAGVGSVVWGDWDLAADGNTGVTAYLFVTATSGDVDSVTIGNVSLAAYNTGSITFSLDVSASGDAGSISIGVIDMSSTVDSTINVDVSGDGGTDASIYIAGVVLRGEELEGGEFDFDITGNSGDVTIDAITVALSATTDGEFDLDDVLTGVTSTGTITLGTIDYSDYALSASSTSSADGAVIDVSSYSGDIVVIGSEGDDTITDNTGINTFTGNGGDDLFYFAITDDANGVGVTAANADVITDFETGSDTIELDVTTTTDFAVTEYHEGTYSSFALFLAGAATQMGSAIEDNLVVGQVGSDVYVAIDMNDGDSVDSVIKLSGTTLSDINYADFDFA